MLRTESIRWRGRDATRLENGVVELIVLTESGHLAKRWLLDKDSFPSQNVLWEAPWMTSCSSGNRLEELSETGGFTGHGICLDYFGALSPDEAAADLPIHGEAATERWNVHDSVNEENATCQWNVQLSGARLRLEREIHLRKQESVVFMEETVKNDRDAVHACHWVQPATFAPPFLNPAESTLAVSATRGITSPSDYEGASLLGNNREFSWPHAPIQRADETNVDLSQPFAVKGRGFLATLQLDPRVKFLLAMNWKLRLRVGYCFRRSDFPWMAIWEENCAGSSGPWNGKVQECGMEFGATPLPLGREETFRRGDIFGTPSWCVIPANGKRTTRYFVFLFAIPAGIQSIQNVEASAMPSFSLMRMPGSCCSIPAHGCEHFLAPDETQDQGDSCHLENLLSKVSTTDSDGMGTIC